MVRAKFQVQGLKTVHWNKTGREITMAPVTDATVPEDITFCKYTPSGELKMFVDNPKALEEFQLGKFFYVDFTEVPGK